MANTHFNLYFPCIVSFAEQIKLGVNTLLPVTNKSQNTILEIDIKNEKLVYNITKKNISSTLYEIPFSSYMSSSISKIKSNTFVITQKVLHSNEEILCDIYHILPDSQYPENLERTGQIAQLRSIIKKKVSECAQHIYQYPNIHYIKMYKVRRKIKVFGHDNYLLQLTPYNLQLIYNNDGSNNNINTMISIKPIIILPLQDCIIASNSKDSIKYALNGSEGDKKILKVTSTNFTYPNESILLSFESKKLHDEFLTNMKDIRKSYEIKIRLPLTPIQNSAAATDTATASATDNDNATASATDNDNATATATDNDNATTTATDNDNVTATDNNNATATDNDSAIVVTTASGNDNDNSTANTVELATKEVVNNTTKDDESTGDIAVNTKEDGIKEQNSAKDDNIQKSIQSITKATKTISIEDTKEDSINRQQFNELESKEGNFQQSSSDAINPDTYKPLKAQDDINPDTDKPLKVQDTIYSNEKLINDIKPVDGDVNVIDNKLSLYNCTTNELKVDLEREGISFNSTSTTPPPPPPPLPSPPLVRQIPTPDSIILPKGCAQNDEMIQYNKTTMLPIGSQDLSRPLPYPDPLGMSIFEIRQNNKVDDIPDTIDIKKSILGTNGIFFDRESRRLQGCIKSVENTTYKQYKDPEYLVRLKADQAKKKAKAAAAQKQEQMKELTISYNNAKLHGSSTLSNKSSEKKFRALGSDLIPVHKINANEVRVREDIDTPPPLPPGAKDIWSDQFLDEMDVATISEHRNRHAAVNDTNTNYGTQYPSSNTNKNNNNKDTDNELNTQSLSPSAIQKKSILQKNKDAVSTTTLSTIDRTELTDTDTNTINELYTDSQRRRSATIGTMNPTIQTQINSPTIASGSLTVSSSQPQIIRSQRGSQVNNNSNRILKSSRDELPSLNAYRTLNINMIDSNVNFTIDIRTQQTKLFSIRKQISNKKIEDLPCFYAFQNSNKNSEEVLFENESHIKLEEIIETKSKVYSDTNEINKFNRAQQYCQNMEKSTINNSNSNTVIVYIKSLSEDKYINQYKELTVYYSMINSKDIEKYVQGKITLDKVTGDITLRDLRPLIDNLLKNKNEFIYSENNYPIAKAMEDTKYIQYYKEPIINIQVSEVVFLQLRKGS